MRKLEEWFSEYSVSHQNEINIAIHYICVPAIFFSIVGLLMSIPPGPLTKIFPMYIPFLENWAVVVLILVLLFYFRLSISMGCKVLVFAMLCIAGNYYLSLDVPLGLVSLIIFLVAWIGQFYGHKIEGEKPSFFKDVQFLLIGPAWVIKKIFG